MGKSGKKSNVEVAPAAVIKKGKREAEEALEKPVSAKKQKKEVQEVQRAAKAEKKSSKIPPPKKKPETSSSEDTSSESEIKEGKSLKANVPSKNLPSTATKIGKDVPLKKVESSDSSESDSSSDEENVNADLKVTAPAKKPIAAAVLKKVDIASDSHKDTAQKTADGSTVVTAKKGGTTKDSSSETSDSESDEDGTPMNVATAKNLVSKSVTTPASKKKEESSGSSESDSEDESSEDAGESSEELSDDSDIEPLKKKQKGSAGVIAVKPSAKVIKKESSSEDEDSSEESSEDDDHPKAQEKKPSKASTKKSSSEEESSEEDSSEESEEEKPAKTLPKKENDVKVKVPSTHGTENQTAKKFQKEKELASNQSEASGSKTLFVGNLPFDAEEDDIKEFFKVAGEVSSIRLAENEDGRRKGFGHVEFVTREAAQKALDELNGQDLLGRDIKLDFARERGSYTPYSGKEKPFQKSENAKSYTIFVKGFDKSLDMNEIQGMLEEHFASCGDITRVALPRDYESGGSKGIGYMDFKDQDALSSALELNGSEIGGYSLFVEEAKPRNEGRDGGWSGGGRGGDRSGGRGGDRSGGGRSGGRGGGWGRGGRGNGRGGGGRGRGGAPFKQSAGTPSRGKKTTFGDY